MDWLTSIPAYLDFGQFAPRWVLLLADGALKASLIVLVAGVVTFAMRTASAAARHAVWAMALGSVLVLPMLATLLPTWDLGLIPTPAHWTASGQRATEPRVILVGVPRASELRPGSIRVPRLPSAPVPRLEGRIRPSRPVAQSPAPEALPAEAGVPGGVVVIPEEGAAGPFPIERGVNARVPVLPRGGVSAGASDSSSWFVLLSVLWTVGLLGVMATLLAALYRVSRMERKAAPVIDRQWITLLNTIRHRLGITRQVGLVRSDSVGTPATWGVAKPVVMIPADADSWSASRKQDVLVHELAHVKRFDFLTQMISRYACAIFWFNPLVWLAARQLRVERERACDDEVLASGTKASTYAGHLLEIARGIKGHSATGLAAVSMAHRSQLTGRLLAVLEEGRRRDSLSRGGSLVLWLSAMLLLTPIVTVRAVGVENTDPRQIPSPMVAAVMAPGPAKASFDVANPEPVLPRSFRATFQQIQWASAPGCHEADAESESRGTNSNSNDDRYTIRWWDEDCEGELRTRGEVRFTTDFLDVASISRNGSFSLEIDADGDSRRVEISPDGGGLERRWFVNGREQPYGPEATAWLPLALEDLFRHSSVAMEERVDHILATRGVQGLIDQASYSHGSYLIGRYYAVAIETGQLQTNEINQLLQRATRRISSDFEMARLLMTIPANELRDPVLRLTYVQASNTISSDFEKRRVLSALLQQPGLDADIVEMLLGSVQDIQSDFELATLLIELGARYLDNPETRNLYLQAAQSIQSDFELRRTLSTLLQRDDLSTDNLRLLLQAATSIKSDFEAATLLIEVADRYVVDESLRTLFFQSVDGISSDFEQRRVLNALMNSERLGPGFVPAILNSGSTIGSDFELAELLTELVAAYELTAATRPVFFTALGTIQSDFEQQRVLLALLSRDGLPADLVNEAIRSTASISSDFSKAMVLTRIANTYRTDQTIRSALEEAAETISSDYEYGRVMAAIRGRAR
jgi:beta-lactamase regulating signal transducer with metallopeptidase domain